MYVDKYGYLLPNTGVTVHWWREDVPGKLLNPQQPIDMYAVSYPGEGWAFPHVYFCGERYSSWLHDRLDAAVERRSKGEVWGTIVAADGPMRMDDVIHKFDRPGWARSLLEYIDPDIRETFVLVHGLNHAEAIIMSYLGKYGNLEVDNV